ncbi:C-type lectin domain family 2 member B-like [Coturnix japonica]|uniref:C-type lectin domain family 2 member B-like n=1 Tax=Coturnix japonica TaxID=93934 RepID=UPI000777180D|nr:C-type lectin domain family 2 member B-like [Coturnix japonica]
MTAGGQQWNSPEHEAKLLCPGEEKQHFKHSCKWNVGRRKSALYSFVSGVLVGVIVGIIIIIIMKLVFGRELQRCELCSPCPEVSHVSHNAWVGFQGKCYYFSDTESAWNISREHCQQLGASLATIDSKEEMEFVLRFRGPANCWIGLHKAEGDERWMWVNGSAFSNWFQLQDGGQCAYLNGDRISSTLCYTEKSWVCSRADGCVHWEQKAFPY